VASPPLAPPPPALSLLVSLEGLRVAEMNQAPEGAPELRKEILPRFNPNS
jgi:hypothetical protein